MEFNSILDSFPTLDTCVRLTESANRAIANARRIRRNADNLVETARAMEHEARNKRDWAAMVAFNVGRAPEALRELEEAMATVNTRDEEPLFLPDDAQDHHEPKEELPSYEEVSAGDSVENPIVIDEPDEVPFEEQWVYCSYCDDVRPRHQLDECNTEWADRWSSWGIEEDEI